MEQSDLAASRRLLCARCKPPGRRRQRHELASPHIGPYSDYCIASAETGTLIPAETIGAVHSQCLRWVSIATKEVEPDDRACPLRPESARQQIHTQQRLAAGEVRRRSKSLPPGGAHSYMVS